jgi:aminoglycoside phosphotransferase (APT) family kinase protein
MSSLIMEQLMIFKANWEKAHEFHVLSTNIVDNMMAVAYPDRKIILQTMVSDGCANLNFKIQLDGDIEPLLLRIYLRDQDAAWREQKLATILLPMVPVPKVIHVCDYKNYRFAITEFIPGITLRDLLLSDEPHDLYDIMYDVGVILSKIACHRFPAAGFFDENLHVIKNLAHDDYLKHAKASLQHNTVFDQLGEAMILKVSSILNSYAHLFPDDKERHLVHADFDPANMLVAKIDNDWKITAILDWEFAFSGSILCDVANMLRYAHQIPLEYEKGFLNGLKSGGISFPDDFKIRIDLLNLFSLLDCLARCDPKQSPNQCADIYSLIKNIIQRLE